MLVKIGNEISINIMAITSFTITEDEATKEKTTLINFSDRSIQLNNEQTKHFESFIEKIVPDISTEQGQNYVVQCLQQISQFRKGK